MVMNQNAAAPTIARITAKITRLRSIGVLSDQAPAKRKGGHRADGRPARAGAKRLRRPLAVGLVAPAAVFAHLGDLNLEAVEILGRVQGRLGIVGELGELRLEIGLVFPDRRQRGGIAADLGVVREQGRRLLARLGEGRQDDVWPRLAAPRTRLGRSLATPALPSFCASRRLPPSVDWPRPPWLNPEHLLANLLQGLPKRREKS